MQRHVGLCIALLALAVSSSAPAGAEEKADEWIDEAVLTRTPDVRLRERPDVESPAFSGSSEGLWFYVTEIQGDWLKVDNGWFRADQVVRAGEAVDFFAGEIARQPSAFAYLGRCRARAEASDFDGAMADVEEAVQCRMAVMFATCPDARFRDGQRALSLAKEVHAARGDDELYSWQALAAAHAECGDFTEAVKWQTKALELIPANDMESREEQQARLDLYQAGKPYRFAVGTSAAKPTETPSR